MKTISILLVAIFFIGGQVYAGEGVCESETGASYSLCNNYCEVLNCDDVTSQRQAQQCLKLYILYWHRNQSAPPCDAITNGCPVWTAEDLNIINLRECNIACKDMDKEHVLSNLRYIEDYSYDDYYDGYTRAIVGRNVENNRYWGQFRDLGEGHEQEVYMELTPEEYEACKQDLIAHSIP